MSPSIFTLASPVETYDILYGIYVHVLLVGLIFSWAGLACLDMAAAKPANAPLWIAGVLTLPLIGAGAYLLMNGTQLSRTARLAIIFGGLIIWLVALAIGLPKIWGPLGPKAL